MYIDIDAIESNEVEFVSKFEREEENPVVEELVLDDKTINNYICREVLLTLFKNIKENTERKTHTCELTPAILQNLNFLNERGLGFSYPKEDQSILELDDIANLKEEIAGHLDTIEKQTPNLPEKIEDVQEQHATKTVADSTQSPIILFKEESKKKTEKFGKNLAFELLHNAGLPTLQKFEETIRKQAVEVEDINKCREALLVIKRHLSKSFDEETKSHPIDEVILEKIAFLDEMGIKLIEIKEGQTEFNMSQLLELKEQISSEVSKLQLEQQTLFTTKINPTLNDRHIILEILKMCLRIESQMMNALIQNQKVN